MKFVVVATTTIDLEIEANSADEALNLANEKMYNDVRQMLIESTEQGIYQTEIDEDLTEDLNK